MRKIAYLFPLFPVINQTFTLAEVVWLNRHGYDLRIYSLKSGVSGKQQPEADELAGVTRYCPRPLSGELWGAFTRAALRRPAAVLRLVSLVVRAWADPVPRRDTEGRDRPATYTFKEWAELLFAANPLTYLAKSLLMVPYAIWLSDALRREGFSHLHCQWATYPATVGLLVSEWSGIPFSISAHAYDIYMVSRMLPAKLSRAAFVVTCADYNRRYLASLTDAEHASRIHLNYHGTDLARFSPDPRTRTGPLEIISVGWLKEYKGFHVLIEAVAELERRGIDTVLHIAGDGPQKPFLEDLAGRLGVAERVNFHGYVDQGRLAELYRQSDVFAIACIAIGGFGRQDVIPNVLAEAMAVEIPVVATRMAGIPELVEDGVDGLLVPQRDPVAIADALERLEREPETAARLAAAGRAKVERIWDRERNLRELAVLLDRYLPDVGKEAA